MTSLECGSGTSPAASIFGVRGVRVAARHVRQRRVEGRFRRVVRDVVAMHEAPVHEIEPMLSQLRASFSTEILPIVVDLRSRRSRGLRIPRMHTGR